MTAKAHADAVKALIGTSVRLYEGDRPDGSPLPAAVLFIAGGDGIRTTLTARSVRRNVSFQVTAVALDPEGVRSVSERVRVALLDRKPVVPGHICWSIRQDGSQHLQLDRDVTPHVYFSVDLYEFASVPAPQ